MLPDSAGAGAGESAAVAPRRMSGSIEYESWEFLTAAVGGGLILVFIVGAHLSACCAACARCRCCCCCFKPSRGAVDPNKLLGTPDGDAATQARMHRSSVGSLNAEEERVPLLDSEAVRGGDHDATTQVMQRREELGLHGPDDYGWPSRFFLVWNIPLVTVGWGTPLDADLIPTLRKHYRSGAGLRITPNCSQMTLAPRPTVFVTSYRCFYVATGFRVIRRGVCVL